MPKLKPINAPPLTDARHAVESLRRYAAGDEPTIRLPDQPAARELFAALTWWFPRLADAYEARADRARLNGAKGEHCGRPRLSERCACGKFTANNKQRHRCVPTEAK